MRTIMIATLAIATGGAADVTIDYTDGDHFSVVIDGMPDFDQVRVGLDENGVGHCFPTVLIDIAAFCSAHGYPGLDPGPQTWQHWQSQDQYDEVTTLIHDLGVILGTDPDLGGTTYGGLTGGFHDWFPSESFALTGSQVDVDEFVLFEDLRDHALAGHMVIACTTFFSDTGGGVLAPGGGHARVLVEISDDGETHAIGWRDPADGPSATVQSAFTTRQYTLERELVNVEGEFTIMDRLVGGAPHEYLTCYWIVVPTCGLTNDGELNQIILRKPWSFLNEPLTEAIQMPGPGPVIHAAINPAAPYFAILQDVGVAQRLWQLDCVTGGFTELATFEAAAAVAYGPDGDIYAINGNSCNRFVGVGPGGGSITIDGACDALDYFDRDERVVVLSAELSKLFFFPPDLSDSSFLELPTELALDPGALMALAPARPGAFACWLADRGASEVWRWDIDAQGVETLFNVSAGGPVDAISVGNDGALHVSREGALRVYRFDPVDGWVEDEGALYAGADAGRFFATSRSRWNVDITQTGPWWDQIVPSEFGEPAPDCPGDIVVDAAVNASDLLALIGGWGTSAPGLDLDGDGVTGLGDLLMLLGRWGPCE